MRPPMRPPLAKKKDTTMSQITSLLNALKVCANVRVLVSTQMVAARKAHAPTGRGSSTKATMVARKMDRSCHACKD